MTLQTTTPAVQQKIGYRYVKYTFFKVDPAWRKLSSEDRKSSKKQFLSSLNQSEDMIRPRSYSLVGTRGDVDFMLWTITDSLETLQGFHSDLLKSELGKYLSTPYSYLAMLRPSEYFGRPSEKEPVGSK